MAHKDNDISTGYTVTAQHYYYSGDRLVEIVRGGLDYSGSDAVCLKGWKTTETFQYPREAVARAIDMARDWRKTANDRRIGVTLVGVGGLGLEGERVPQVTALSWARQEYNRIAKCDRCGDILPAQYFTADDWSGDRYCREYCAEEAARFNAECEAETIEE